MWEQEQIIDMMSKFPLGNLIRELFPEPSTATTSPARPASEPCNVTPTAQVFTVTPPQPVINLTAATIDLTATTIDLTAAATAQYKVKPKKRRRQIQFAYELLGSPPEFVTVQDSDVSVNQWDGKHGVINTISTYLHLKRARNTISRVLEFYTKQT